MELLTIVGVGLALKYIEFRAQVREYNERNKKYLHRSKKQDEKYHKSLGEH